MKRGGGKEFCGVFSRLSCAVLDWFKERKWAKGPSARRPVEWSWRLRSCLCPVLCSCTSPAPVAPGRKPREVDAAVAPGSMFPVGFEPATLT